MDVLRQIIRKEGLLGLYAGMESTFWRYIGPNFQLDNKFHVASDTCTGMEDILVAFIKSKRYFQNPMSVLCFFFRRTRSKFYRFGTEPTSATHEQLRVWFHRWFCRYRVEYTVSHSAMSTFIGDVNNA